MFAIMIQHGPESCWDEFAGFHEDRQTAYRAADYLESMGFVVSVEFLELA